VFRSGCCFRRGAGRVFYFSPGHETYPVYHRGDVQRILANAVEWASPGGSRAPVASDSEHAPYGWWQAQAE
jgi:trehalose utilization protein